jgi:hypothetical protein
MVSLIGGLVALFLGIVGLAVWWGYFLTVLKGAIPILLFIGGIIAIYGGGTAIKDKMEAGKEEIEKKISEKTKKEEKKNK